ncbi:hypothetical protein LguiA_012639 [Lonicera macranthoides]
MDKITDICWQRKDRRITSICHWIFAYMSFLSLRQTMVIGFKRRWSLSRMER